MKEVLSRLFRMFGKYIFAGILLLVSILIYYVICRDGINSFYQGPVVGVLTIMAIAFINVLYFVFLFKKKDKTTFGK